MNILLVEDNENIVVGLEYSFLKSGYNMTSKRSLKEAAEYLDEMGADIVILDISLPDGNGFQFYENTIKAKGIPTIILTALDDEESVVKGLDIGAEDYMTKPFSTKELLARVNKILLRQKKTNIVKIRGLEYNMDKMTVAKDGKEIELTGLEIKLLNLFLSNLGRVVTRENILERIWEWTGNDVDDHTVTVYVKRLREKLGVDIITTLKGIGYRIDGE